MYIRFPFLSFCILFFPLSFISTFVLYPPKSKCLFLASTFQYVCMYPGTSTPYVVNPNRSSRSIIQKSYPNSRSSGSSNKQTANPLLRVVYILSPSLSLLHHTYCYNDVSRRRDLEDRILEDFFVVLSFSLLLRLFL